MRPESSAREADYPMNLILLRRAVCTASQNSAKQKARKCFLRSRTG
jgi:hypothetical protein